MKRQSYFSFILFSGIVLMTSCLTIRPNAPAKKTNILSKKRLHKVLKHHLMTEATSNEHGDWTYFASDRMMYSALVHGEAPILTITYTVEPNMDMIDFYRKNDTLPDNLLAKRDSIINFVWEKEKKYQNKPHLKKHDLLPYGLRNDSPLIQIIVTDPSIIRPLRKDKNIRSISPDHYNFDLFD